MTRFKILLFSFAVILFIFPEEILAQSSITSPNYIIQMPNFNSGAGIPSSTNYKMDTTIGQTAPGLFTSNGYYVKSGFQYIHSIIPFSFTISDFLINFETLIPGVPATASATLTVSAGGAGGYRVTARESDYMKSSDGSSIPDTTCDATDCSESVAQVWSLGTTYGLGFNMSGDDVPADFVNGTYYRHFANQAQSETDQTIMSSVNVGRSRNSTITYKVNTSPIQPAGEYKNLVLFTAIPSY